MRPNRLLLLVFFLFSLVPAARGDELRPGDVLVGGLWDGVLGPGFTAVDWIRGGTKLPTPLNGDVTGIALHPDGRLFLATLYGLRTITPQFQTIANHLPDGVSGLVFNSNGTLYTTDFASRLLELGPDGSIVRTAPSDAEELVVDLDLAADQCTLYIASIWEARPVHRFDVCRWQPLSDLSPQPFASGIRVDRDGTLLVPDGNRILRLTPTGAVAATYAFPSLQTIRGIAFAADGTPWVTSGVAVEGPSGFPSSLYHLDLASQRVLAGPIPLSSYAYAITVVGEPRAALRPNPAAIPAAGPVGLALLAMTLAAVALFARNPLA